MARTGVKGEDFLGVLAFASGVVNLIQVADRAKLQTMYNQLLARYRQVQAEYTAMRNLLAQLQKQVVELREKNNQLMAELAKKPLTPKP